MRTPIRTLLLDRATAAFDFEGPLPADPVQGLPGVEFEAWSSISQVGDRLGRGDLDVTLLHLSSEGVDLNEDLIARLAEAGTPVVVISDGDSEVECRAAIQAGAEDYVPACEVSIATLTRVMLCALERRSRKQVSGTAALLRFGDFELDAERALLWDGGRPVELQRTPRRLLAHLVAHRDRSISKDELLDEVWAGASVSDAAISSALKELRRALRDDGAQQQVIETQRGVGYRFVAPLERAMAMAAEAEPVRSPSAERGLAVIPFDDLSRCQQDGYLALGLTDAMIDALAHLDGMRVVSRTSTMRFRCAERAPSQIARELRVDLLLAGSVLREGDRIRIGVELLDAESERVIWAGRYDRCGREDVLDLQSEVAQAVLGEIRGRPEVAAASGWSPASQAPTPEEGASAHAGGAGGGIGAGAGPTARIPEPA